MLCLHMGRSGILHHGEEVCFTLHVEEFTTQTGSFETWKGNLGFKYMKVFYSPSFGKVSQSK